MGTGAKLNQEGGNTITPFLKQESCLPLWTSRSSPTGLGTSGNWDTSRHPTVHAPCSDLGFVKKKARSLSFHMLRSSFRLLKCITEWTRGIASRQEEAWKLSFQARFSQCLFHSFICIPLRNGGVDAIPNLVLHLKKKLPWNWSSTKGLAAQAMFRPCSAIRPCTPYLASPPRGPRGGQPSVGRWPRGSRCRSRRRSHRRPGPWGRTPGGGRKLKHANG